MGIPVSSAVADLVMENIETRALETLTDPPPVAWPTQNLGEQKFGVGQMFDFGRITLFFLGYRFSQHKMTIRSKHLEWAMAP